MASTLRFAVGEVEVPASGVWHLVAQGADVYLGASARAMGLLKFSLHASGVWVLAATEQSKMTFADGNRRAKQWTRPAEHYPGWTRGPGILVPHIAWPKRPPVTSAKHIVWVPEPPPDQVVEFSLYLAAPDAADPKWRDGELVGERNLRSGARVVVRWVYRQMTAKFESTAGWMVGTTVIRGPRPEDLVEGELLWVTESQDRLRVPLIVDLPANVGTHDPSAVIAAADPLAVRPTRPSTLREWKESLKRD